MFGNLLIDPGLLGTIFEGVPIRFISGACVEELFAVEICNRLDILFPMPRMRSLLRSATRGIDIA